MAPDGFMTASCMIDFNDSQHRDQIFCCVHMFVDAGDSCRLPDLCGALVTGFARALQQRTAKESSFEGSVTWFRGECVPRFFGELT
jgi:hypothetical protein